jgi:hypothetical protein
VTEIEQLLATDEIRKIKARYCRAIDTQDWDLLSELFTEDAVMDMSATGGTDVTGERIRRSRDEIVKWLSKTLAPGAVALHRGFMDEITFTSATTADAVWAGEWDAWFAPESPLKERHGAGYYYESYRKDNGRWLVSHLRIGSVLREEVLKR